MTRAAQSAEELSFEATGRDARRPWMVIALIATLLMLTLVGSASDVYSGQLTDTDSYSWVNRVVDLQEQGDWHDDTIERIEPDGLKQHWSRPFDAVLVAVPALASSLGYSFRDSLLAWAIVLPVFLGLAVVIALWRWFGNLLTAEGLFALAVMLPFNGAVIAGFQAGRADHQTLIGLLAVVVVGMATTTLTSSTPTMRGGGVAIGVLGSLALWVAMESMLFIGMIVLTLGIRWVVGLQAIAGLESFLVGLTGGTTLALLLENGVGGLGSVVLDELSIVFVIFFGLSASLAHVLGRKGEAGVGGRLLLASGGGVAIVAVMVVLFPEITSGPLGEVDPFYDEIRLQKIAEIQPVLSGGLPSSIGRFALALSFLPFALLGFALAAKRGLLRSAPQWQMLLCGAIVYAPLTVLQIRWATTAAILLAVPAAFGVQSIMSEPLPDDRVGHRFGRYAVSFVAALWWIPVVVWAASAGLAIGENCDPRLLVDLVEESDAGDGDLLVVMTDHGPRVLFETDLHVLSIPNHRYQPGFRSTYEIMNARGEEEPQRLLAEADVEFLAICPSEVEAAFYGSDAESLRLRLIDGWRPQWLEEVRLAEAAPQEEGDAPHFLLFEVGELQSS